MAYRYSVTERFDSKACEGVSYTIYRMTEGRKREMRLRTADPTDELRRIGKDAEKLEGIKKDQGDSADPEIDQRLEELYFKSQVITVNKLQPVWMEYGLCKLEGLEIKDPSSEEFREATAKDIDLAPPELYSEILVSVQKELGLLKEEAENLKLPSTSSEVEGGISPSTIVTSAETKESIEPETAVGISPI